jgi:putative radical SAM enzyme (TIGR03279 family)
MVDGPRSGEIIDQLRRLGELGIRCHTQLVLCPGINDGDELERSIADLAALRPTVASISVVPVGLTKYNNLLKVGDLPAMRTYTRPEAEEVVRRVEQWQKRFTAEPDGGGSPFTYLSDEWYYITGHPFPRARHYGDYAQLENGVGMTRKLQDDWRVARRGLPRSVEPGRKLAIVTGVMAEPVMRRLAHDLERAQGLESRVIPVENRFFGPLVTVAGLLSGQDILDEVLRCTTEFSPEDLLVLPRVALDNGGTRFLDDLCVDEFRGQVPAQVVFAKTAADLAGAVQSLACR